MNNNDFIFIEKLETLCRIGCTIEERAFPQVVSVDISIFLPLDSPAKSLLLGDTVDYAKVIENTKKILAQQEFSLLETAAESIATMVLQDKKVDHVTVRLHKKVFPDVNATGVTITRKN